MNAVPGLRVDVCALDEFRPHPAAWNDLVLAMARPSVFLVWEWLATWEQVFGRRRQTFVLRARDGERLVGLLPLVRSWTSLEDGLLPARVLSPAAALDLKTDCLDVICAPEHGRAVLLAMFEHLAGRRRDWDILHFPRIAADRSLHVHLPELARIFSVDVRRSSRATYLTVGPSYAEFFGRMKQKRRREVERSGERFLTTPERQYRLAVGAEAEEALEFLLSVQARRFTSPWHRLLRDDRAQFAFQRQALRRLLVADRVRMAVLRDGGRIVAVNYVLAFGNRFFGYRMAMDPAWSRLEPGKLLLARIVEQAFTEQIAEFDFLQGGGMHKAHWASGERDLFNLNFVRRAPYARLVAATFSLRRTLAQGKRRLRARETAPHV